MAYPEDPPHASYNLSVWWRANFSNVPWVGEASDGESSGRELTTSAGLSAPSPGTSVNGFVPASLDGSTQSFSYEGGHLYTVFSPEAFTVVLVVKPKNPSGPKTTQNYFSGENLIGDFNNIWGIAWSTSGVSLWYAYSSTAWRETPWVPCAPDKWHVIAARFDGSTLSLSVDGGTPTTISGAGDMLFTTTSRLTVGRSFGTTPQYLVNEDVLEIAASQTVLSDVELTAMREHFAYRYGIGGVYVDDSISIGTVLQYTLQASNSNLKSFQLEDTCAVTDSLSVLPLRAPRAVVLGPRAVRVDFGTLMLNDAALTDASNYTFTDLTVSVGTIPGGPLPTDIIEVRAEPTINPTSAILTTRAELPSSAFYSLRLSNSIMTSESVVPSRQSFVLGWVKPTNTFVVPFNPRGEEAHGGLLGEHGGLVYFSPALNESSANSIVQVDEVDVCTTAYDEYRFPQMVDPAPLHTYLPGGPVSELSKNSVLWTRWYRLNEAQFAFGRKHSETLPVSASPSVISATFTVAGIEYTREWTEGFENIPRTSLGFNEIAAVTDSTLISYGDNLWKETHSDAFQTSDSMLVAKATGIFINETLAFAEELIIGYNRVKEVDIVDALTTPDQLIVASSNAITLADTVSVGVDSISSAKATSLTFDDSFAGTDTATAGRGFDKSGSDSMVAADSAPTIFFTQAYPAGLSLRLWTRGGSYAGNWPSLSTIVSSSFGQWSPETMPNIRTDVGQLRNYNYPDFDNDALVLNQTVDTVMGRYTWHVVVLARIDAIDTTSTGAINTNDQIISNELGHFGMGLRYDSVSAQYYMDGWQHDGTANKKASQVVTLGQWAMYETLFDGNTMYVAKNAASMVSGDFSLNMNSGAAVTSRITLGRGNSGQRFDGGLMEVMIRINPFSASERSSIKGYFNSRYNLSL